MDWGGMRGKFEFYLDNWDCTDGMDIGYTFSLMMGAKTTKDKTKDETENARKTRNLLKCERTTKTRHRIGDGRYNWKRLLQMMDYVLNSFLLLFFLLPVSPGTRLVFGAAGELNCNPSSVSFLFCFLCVGTFLWRVRLKRATRGRQTIRTTNKFLICRIISCTLCLPASIKSYKSKYVYYVCTYKQRLWLCCVRLRPLSRPNVAKWFPMLSKRTKKM